MGRLPFQHACLLRNSDCQPCFRWTETSSPWDDSVASVVSVSCVSKSRFAFIELRQDEQCKRRIRDSRAAIHAFITGIRGSWYGFLQAAVASDSLVRKTQFRSRVVGNGEFERSAGDSGDGILTRDRKGEEESRYYAGKDDRKAGGEDCDDVGNDDVGTVAKRATRAVKMENSESALEIDGRDSRAAEDSGSLKEGHSGLQDERFLRKLAAAENADAALGMINDRGGGGGGFMSNEDCSALILAAIAQNNVDLAFSILNAMRSSLLQRRIDRHDDSTGRNWGWRWPQPDVTTYAALVRGLAASLRVSDAIQTVGDVRRLGVPQGDEVPFGKVVTCPTCKTSLAVVQPQQGVQLVPCASCRYQYELMSGTIVRSESESVSLDMPFWERALQVLPFLNRKTPAAVHSVVVQAPDGLAQTHRFATESADVPAQEGERVTIILASPSNVGRGIGPFRLNARAPGWRPREPMGVTNHVTGQVLSLIRAPPKTGSGAALDTSVIVPIVLLLASTDAASGLIDPTLPRTIALGAAAVLTLGGATNTFLLPLLNQLPQRTVDAIALRQRLLAQYEQLQARLQDLTKAASNEVRMLARMCQLQNKMEAVGGSSYSARIERVHKAREGLDERLAARLKLIDSYAKVASMIEIEVEMDIDVLVAEAASPEATIAEQIDRLMEVESLQNEWKNQAEANDEVERLLRSEPLLPD